MDYLLLATIIALGLIVAAYLYMPDFKRGIHTLVAHFAPMVGLG